MSTAYFIDLDGVVVKPGTQELLPGVVERLRSIASEDGSSVYFFSCWAFYARDREFLSNLVQECGWRSWGFIHKPLADRYVYIDDKLDVAACRTKL